jgi:hypothetical protein
MKAGVRIVARPHPEGYLEGRAADAGDPRGALLASFLQSDVQGDLAYAGELLAEIAAAERGEAPLPRRIGNAFAIEIGADGGVIRNVVLDDAEPERFSLGELREALALWAAAIERARKPR